MSSTTNAQRTLVKSPPELWAEVSDVEALARHLGEFGEIRITRLAPETTVAWEGDRVRGTVELEPSGWGTRVTLTARIEPPPPEPQPPVAVAVAEQRAAPPPAPGPISEPAHPTSSPAVPPTRSGLWAWLFARRPAVPAAPAQAPLAVAVAVPEPSPEPAVEAAQPVAAVTAPEPVPTKPLDETHAAAILTRVLDDLGSAHHRPFSRG
jgi:hypothetical protein